MHFCFSCRGQWVARSMLGSFNDTFLPAVAVPLHLEDIIADAPRVVGVRGELGVAPELDAGLAQRLAFVEQQPQLAVGSGAARVELDPFAEGLFGLAAAEPLVHRALLRGSLGEPQPAGEE